MPTPTGRQSHFDQALTNVAIAYRNAAYVYDQVFPVVPVTKQTNKYFIFPKADWFRDEPQVRAPGTRAVRAEYTLSSGNYVCVEKAIAKIVPDETTENSDAPLQPLVTATEFATDQLQKALEIEVLGNVFGTGWASSATPSPLWSDDTSNPLGDMETGMITVACAIGREPNVGVIGRSLWRYLKNHPDVVDRFKYTGTTNAPAVAKLQAIAGMIGLEKLLLAGAVYDSGTEGSTASQGFIAGAHLWLGYVAGGANINTPTAGYVFTWRNREVNRFREEEEHADVVEARASWDTVLTATDAGYLIKSAA